MCDDALKHVFKLQILINMRRGSETKLWSTGQTGEERDASTIAHCSEREQSITVNKNEEIMVQLFKLGSYMPPWGVCVCHYDK